MTPRAIAILVAGCLAQPVWAGDVVYLFANSDYDRLDDVADADRIEEIADPLRDSGADVVVVRDAKATDLVRQAGNLLRDARGADSLLVIVTGHVASTAGDSWLLGVDSRGINAVNAGRQGLSLSALTEVLALTPGHGALMVATTPEEFGTGFATVKGAQMVQIAPGTALITGSFDAIAGAVTDGLTRDTGSLRAILTDDALSGSGYIADTNFFGGTAVPQTVTVSRDVADPQAGYWLATEDTNTVEGFERYLERYPQGANAAAARQRIAAIRQAPEQAAQSAEEAMALDREARRKVQRDLSLLGLEPRGIDGIFGPGTRAAITRLQESRGLPANGYLDPGLRDILRQAAATRTVELEREAETRRAQQQAEDLAFWRQTGASGAEGDLRAYIGKYPDGQFAGSAREQLAQIDERNRAQAESAERNVWDEVTQVGTADAFQRYLNEFPKGQFADAARNRLAEFQQADQDRGLMEAAQQQENQIAGNLPTRLLIEQRLRQLGLDTGAPDGNFNAQTRAALRQYQRERGIEVSGFVTQQTLVRLLAGR